MEQNLCRIRSLRVKNSILELAALYVLLARQILLVYCVVLHGRQRRRNILFLLLLTGSLLHFEPLKDLHGTPCDTFALRWCTNSFQMLCRLLLLLLVFASRLVNLVGGLHEITQKTGFTCLILPDFLLLNTGLTVRRWLAGWSFRSRKSPHIWV